MEATLSINSKVPWHPPFAPQNRMCSLDVNTSKSSFKGIVSTLSRRKFTSVFIFKWQNYFWSRWLFYILFALWLSSIPHYQKTCRMTGLARLVMKVFSGCFAGGSRLISFLNEWLSLACPHCALWGSAVTRHDIISERWVCFPPPLLTVQHGEGKEDRQ